MFQLLAITAAILFAFALPAVTDDMLIVTATVIFVFGGLPHGAFDIHLAGKQANLSRSQLIKFTAIYIGAFIAMMFAWTVIPSVVLVLFLATAIWHFSEDWAVLKEPLLRIALGAAPLCAIAFGHPEAVADIFAIMSSQKTGQIISNGFVLISPVVLLVGVAALCARASEGAPVPAAIYGAMLICLIALPPVLGFALYFCAFHTPQHLIEIRDQFSDWKLVRLASVGMAITLLAVVAGLFFFAPALDDELVSSATAFQFLASLAVPHQIARSLMGSDKRPL